MADVIPNEGLENLMRAAFDSGFPIKARLFKTDHTPGPDTVLGSLTEADFSGYAAVTLAPLVPPDVVTDGIVRSQEVEANFAHNGGATSNNVYGYYVTLEADSGPQLLWVGRDEDAPVAMAAADDAYSLAIAVLETQEV